MAITGSSISHLARAPIEVAVRAALAARGRFDRDDVDRAMVHIMTSLSPDTLRAIAIDPTGSSHLLQAAIPSATANIAVNTREVRNRYGPVAGPSDFGTGRTWAGDRWGAGFHTASYGDSDGEAGPASSMRFDDTYLRSPAGREMQAIAHECGLHWAIHRADVLRLGPEAIRLFARTGLTDTTFDRMRHVGFHGRQVVNMARFAHRTGLNVNHVGEITADTVEIMGGGSAAERQRWRDMIDAYHADPGNAEARGRLLEELRSKQRDGTQAERDQADKHLNLMGQADQALAAANTLTAGATTAQQQTDAGIDDLNGPAPGTGQRQIVQPTMHVAGPR